MTHTRPASPTVLRTTAWTFLVIFLLPTLAGAQLGLAAFHLFAWPEDGQPRLGEVVAAGDFDGDGFDDLAVASPSADVYGPANSGRVSLRRVMPDGQIQLSQMYNCLDNTDHGENYRLGAAVAFGDFDGDGDDDMAVGMPGALAGGVDSGAVCVVEAGQGALGSSPRTKFSQVDLGTAPEPGDLFGAVLTAGDLNADGYEDLAIGSPGEGIFHEGAEVENAGVVHVLFGGPEGLSVVDAELLGRGLTGVGWDPAADEGFGSALAIGDFHLGPANDLVVGAPGDHPSATGGSVSLFYGEVGGGIAGSSVPMNTAGVVWDLIGTAVPGDRFGAALAPGDFDGDGLTDLAIGIPGDTDFGPQSQAGAVMVVYGFAGSLSDQGEQVFAESFWGGTVAAFDQFGSALATGDFDADGQDDLAIGSPFDNSLGVIDAGEVTVLYGSNSGLQQAGLQIINMIFFDTLDPFDQFGSALATGRFFDSHGGDDLFVGVPGRAHETNGGEIWTNAGLSVVVQSTLFFADDLETGDLSAWSVVVQ